MTESEKEATKYAICYPKVEKGEILTSKDLQEAYIAGAEPREKRIADLEKENAALKERNIKDCKNFNEAIKEISERLNQKYYQLTKAKEIIKTLVDYEKANAIILNYNEFLKQAEDFIKGEEIYARDGEL